MMRKLVFILIAFIAAATFIRALDVNNPASGGIPAEIPGGAVSADREY
jgi:hypothetical protein